jgi:hypothetical protein
VDFGPNDKENGNATSSPDKNGVFWNNVSNPEYKASLPLFDAHKSSQQMVLEMNDSMGKNGIQHGGLLTPRTEALSDLAVFTATQDYFYVNGENKASILLKGLDTNKQYKFFIFGSRNTQIPRKSFYALHGKNVSHGILQTSGIKPTGSTDRIHGNDAKVFVSNLIQPTKEGTIDLHIKIAEGGFAYLNALKIEIYNPR